MIRIANGQGFWGDSLEAPVEQVRRGPLDYLTLDYLAEAAGLQLDDTVPALPRGYEPRNESGRLPERFRHKLNTLVESFDDR